MWREYVLHIGWSHIRKFNATGLTHVSTNAYLPNRWHTVDAVVHGNENIDWYSEAGLHSGPVLSEFVFK